MPLVVNPVYLESKEYEVQYTKRFETVRVSAPSVDEAKTLFDYLCEKTGILSGR
jgi:hypothetical protein